MNITVIGTGYVGLSTGVCLAEIGHSVVCIDIDENKINMLRQGIPPIYERGLKELLEKNLKKGNLIFTTSYTEGLEKAEIILIAVGTPSDANGAADLSYLDKAVDTIASHLKRDAIIVIKSTVPVGTNEYVKKVFSEKLPPSVHIEVVSNPEFLRQGSAISDTMNGDRIVIGAENKDAALKIEKMYKPLNIPVLMTDPKSAELIKYASNAFLATKISFINEIAALCEAAGADVSSVSRGMGMDKRIGSAFLNAGIGYGGSCFPKDVKALLHTAGKYGIDFSLLKNTVAINERQHELLVKKAAGRFKQLQGKKFALLGLAFKPETDDMREAPSIKIARSLLQSGAAVSAYDPKATEKAKQIIGPNIHYASTIEEALKNTDAALIVTEWEEIKQMDIEKNIKLMKRPIIFDGRNCLDEKQLKKCGELEYYPVGKPPMIIRPEENRQ